MLLISLTGAKNPLKLRYTPSLVSSVKISYLA